MKKAGNTVTCFVEKAGFEPRTLGTKRSAMTTALHAQLHMCARLAGEKLGQQQQQE